MNATTIVCKPTQSQIYAAVFSKTHNTASQNICMDIENRSKLALDCRAALAQLLRELRSMSLPEISEHIGYRSSSGAQAALARHNKRIIELKQNARAHLRAQGLA